MKEITCPQCGYKLPLHFKYTKLIKCPSCGSTIFLEDEVVKVIGKESVIATPPSLIKLYKRFKIKDKEYLPVGVIYYEYDRFSWSEWWILNKRGVGFWLSIDDGDYILEEETSYKLSKIWFKDFALGMVVDGWRVTELGEGVCIGFEGELPEKIIIGQSHYYVHLSKPNGVFATAEFSGAKRWFFLGKWIDPFEIEVLDG